nr:hypothetical protein [uncultured Roseococcus sp.]
MASSQHYDVALCLGDLTHSSLALLATNSQEARRLAQDDAARTSGGDPADWRVVSCDLVPAPMRRAA